MTIGGAKQHAVGGASQWHGCSLRSFGVLRGPLIVGLAALLLRLFVLFYADIIIDDAYITFRVARNISDGMGAVYNAGDRVQASTSILYTLVCASLWKVFGTTALLIVRLAASVTDAFCAAAVTWWVERSSAGVAKRSVVEAAALMCGGFYATISTSANIVTTGLETAFYAAAVLFACMAAGRGQFIRAARIAAIAALLRPDGVLVLAAVGAVAVIARDTKGPLSAATWLLVPGYGFQLLYYGTLVPQTVAAKALAQRSQAEQWNLVFSKFFWGDPVRVGLGILILYGLWIGIRSRQFAAFFGWAILYTCIFSTFGTWWPWYWPPLVLAFAAALGLGIANLMSLVVERGAPTRLVIWTTLALTAVMGGLFVRKSVNAATVMRALRPAVTIQRLDLANWLRDHAGPNDSVLVEPMGQIGFHVAIRIDDYPGLASRKVTAALATLHRRVGGSPMDAEALQVVLHEVRPTYVILRKQEFENAGVLDPYKVVHITEQSAEVTAIAPDQQSMYVLARTP